MFQMTRQFEFFHEVWFQIKSPSSLPLGDSCVAKMLKNKSISAFIAVSQLHYLSEEVIIV